jgi:hypothetical protein
MKNNVVTNIVSAISGVNTEDEAGLEPHYRLRHNNDVVRDMLALMSRNSIWITPEFGKFAAFYGGMAF